MDATTSLLAPGESMTMKAILEIAKYTGASAVALALDYGIYWSLAGLLAVDIGLAAAVGYLAGLALAYMLLIYGVFARRSTSRGRSAEAGLFVLSGLLGLALTYITAALASRVLGGTLHDAKLCAVAVSFVSVYLFRKLVVFRGT